MYIYTCRVYLEKLEETNEKVLVLNLIQKKKYKSRAFSSNTSG